MGISQRCFTPKHQATNHIHSYISKNHTNSFRCPTLTHQTPSALSRQELKFTPNHNTQRRSKASTTPNVRTLENPPFGHPSRSQLHGGRRRWGTSPTRATLLSASSYKYLKTMKSSNDAQHPNSRNPYSGIFRAYSFIGIVPG